MHASFACSCQKGTTADWLTDAMKALTAKCVYCRLLVQMTEVWAVSSASMDDHTWSIGLLPSTCGQQPSAQAVCIDQMPGLQECSLHRDDP